MAHSISVNAALESIAVILKAYPGTPSQRPERLAAEQILRVSELLAQADKIKWSKIPRIFIVLHMIARLDAIDTFIEEDISDLWFPFAARTLPDGFRGASDRYHFLELQHFVLTKALDLEREDGKHRHFASADEVPFRKLAELGKGGFGAVDRVLSTITHREYARKRIPRGKTFRRNAEKLKDFERELQHLKKLRHEHIVRLVGSYTDPKYVRILMAPVADGNLKQFLTCDLTKSDKSLLRTFYGCLATAVQYLHDENIRHKDIKPQNILVKGHQVFLTDFGISVDWSGSGQSTTTGSTLKTPKYCAPEVAQNLPRNSASDLWSLGCVFLEIWTVLKGGTLDSLDDFLVAHGNETRWYHHGPGAVVRWCTEMQVKSITACEDAPVEWIQGLLQVNPEARWAAQKLVACIKDTHNHYNNDLSFVGECCLECNDSSVSDTSSDRSSRAFDETGASTIEVYEPLSSDCRPVRHQPSASRRAKLESNSLRDVSSTGPHPSRNALQAPHIYSAPQQVADIVRRQGHPAISESHTDLSKLKAISVSESTTVAVNHVGSDTLETQHQTLLNSVAGPTSMSVRTPEQSGGGLVGPSPPHKYLLSSLQSSSLPKTSITLYNTIPSVLNVQTTDIRCTAKLLGHQKEIFAVVFSPDGKTIASGSNDQTIRLWDTGTGQTRYKLSGHSYSVNTVAFSPDGKTIASGSDDQTIRLWDTGTGQNRYTLLGHSSPITTVAFSPDGKTIVSCSRGQTIRLWDIDSGLPRYILRYILAGHQGTVFTVVFSPDGKTIASGSSDKTIRLWDTGTRQTRYTLSGHRAWVSTVVFSPDGKTIASGSGDKTIRLWDIGTGQNRHTLPGHSHWISRVVFSPNGRTIASGSDDQTIRLWDTDTGQNRYTLLGHGARINRVVFSPDGKTIASGSGDRTIRLWTAVVKNEDKTSNKWSGALRRTLKGRRSKSA